VQRRLAPLPAVVFQSVDRMSKNKVCRIVLAFVLSGSGYFVQADESSLPEVLKQSSVAVARPDKGYLLSVARAGERLVAVGENGRVILSDDFGRTWRQASVPVNVLLTQVRFATATQGWAIGHLGVVLHTADGGDTWVTQLNGVKAAQLFMEQAQRDITRLGDQDAGAAQALHQARLLVEDGPDKPLLVLQVEDAQRITVFGAFGMALRSVDGGQRWEPLRTKDFNPNSLHYYAMTSRAGQDWVVGEQGLLLRGLGDGAYQALQQPYPGTLFGMVTTDSAALAFGLRGNAVRSLDRGEHWQQIKTGTAASLQGGLVLRDGRILLFAENGQIVLGDQRAEHFQLVDKQLLPATEAVEVRDDQLVLVGPGGVQTLNLALAESTQ
jgi:photosystem II stability/assembly factor-like uncharacterized protein